jgi:hypothetical protein
VKTVSLKVTPIRRKKSVPSEPKNGVTSLKKVRSPRDSSGDLEKQINIKIKKLEKKYKSNALVTPKIVKFLDSSPGSSPDTKSQKSVEKFDNRSKIIQIFENFRIPSDNLNEIINDFESVFLNFINNNFNSFTEKDIQGMIELHLRKNLHYNKCDPLKIEEIISSVSKI